MNRTSRTIALVAAVVGSMLALAAAAAARTASAPPVGPLPAGPASTISTQRGQLVAVALPRRANGRVWRIARAIDPKVLVQVSEGDLGASVVLVFRAKARGTARVFFGLTRGETAKAYEARRFVVEVR